MIFIYEILALNCSLIFLIAIHEKLVVARLRKQV